MARIDSIETMILDIPTIRPHVLAMTTMHKQSVVLVRLRCSDGLEGFGEGTTIGGLSYGEESPESIKSAIDTYIAPLLMAADPDKIGETMSAIRRSVKRNHFAKCAVETALLDMAGRRRGVPVSEMIGGGRVRSTLPVAWTLASGNTAKDIDEAEEMLGTRRHNIFKLKIGKRAVEADANHVGAICRAVEGRASVRVDVNQNWSEAEADRGMALLRDAGVDLVEQPIAGDAISALARLAARHGIPVMADEALHGPRSAFALASAGAAQVFAVKIAQSGGLLAGAEVGHIAAAAGIGLYGGTMLEAGVGTIASAHLFSTFDSLDWGTELFGPLLLTEEILSEPIGYRDFSMPVPTGAGLGIALDEDRVAYFRRDRTAPLLHAVSGG